jgi:geranylgeranyl diphosphate synthase, type II
VTRRTSRTNSSSEPAAVFARYLDAAARRVDAVLGRALPGERVHPAIIHRAMRYTALAEGKRLRPALVLLAYEACGGTGRKADPLGAAVEMVHAFSLIHDDLPAMDDDDYRRGKPSNHVVFGEGVAILAGDALLAQAFETVSSLRRPRALGAEVTARLLEELADATGSRGVIGGQVLDLLSEGKRVPRSTVDYIHRHKTARLFTAALRLGGIAAGAAPPRLGALSRFGEAAGFAFQIVDDILGEAGTFRELGRDPGRDRAKGKVTYPRLAGLPASHRAVDRLLAAAGKDGMRLGAKAPLFAGFLSLVDARRRDPDGRPLAAEARR